MNRDNILKKLINSICNPDKVYREYIKDGILKAVIYLVFLCLILGGLEAGIKAFRFNAQLTDTVSSLKEDKYKFDITEGLLNIESSPIKIDENNILIYIDKDKSIEEDDSLRSLTIHEDTYVLILKDGIIIDSNVSENLYPTKIKYTYIELQMADNINNERVINGIDSMRIPIISTYIIMVILYEFINYLAKAFFMAIIFLAVSKVLGFKFRLIELISLVIYIQTLPSVLVLALTIAIPGVLFDMSGMIGTSLYMFLILKNIKKEGIN